MHCELSLHDFFYFLLLLTQVNEYRKNVLLVGSSC